MLLLRDFLWTTFVVAANRAESTVVFSLFAVSGDGICAIDFRERGRCIPTLGLSTLAIVDRAPRELAVCLSVSIPGEARSMLSFVENGTSVILKSKQC